MALDVLALLITWAAIFTLPVLVGLAVTKTVVAIDRRLERRSAAKHQPSATPTPYITDGGNAEPDRDRHD